MGYRSLTMTMETKNQIFSRFLGEYLKAGRNRKKEILNVVCDATKMHRKAAIRKFRAIQLKDGSKQDRRGRHYFYTPDVTAALKKIWQMGSGVCGELLHPAIPEYVEILRRDKMWKYPEDTTQRLLQMSEATAKRRISGFESARRIQKGLSSTRPSALKEIIPIFTGPWTDKPPGHGQIDTVVHCGSTLSGSMIYTVNYTDVATLWVVPRAQWNKGQEATQETIANIEMALPFPLLGLHPDSGSEFVNWFLKEWCDEKKIDLTRSRPSHKNDNAYVEERNGHVVRKFFGYARLDTPEIVPWMNKTYILLSLYLNHFVRSKRCIEKIRIGSKYKRKYEKPLTPYARVLAHPMISDEVKTRLTEEHKKLNPLILKQEIDTLIAKVFDIQRRSGDTKDLSRIG